MNCPNCKQEMHESRPKVYYCQTPNCEIAYIILRDARVKVVDMDE